MSEPVRPNLFVVGAPKCGTTALTHYLAERDDVFLTTPKEPFFFCDDLPAVRAESYLPDEAAYLALFREADPARHAVVAEASTAYLRSAVAVERALAFSPGARVIAMLRDPVEIAHAFHMEQMFDRNEDVEDFERAWALQPARRGGEALPRRCRKPEFLDYRETAAIGAQLRRLFDLVPEERRLVLVQEDFRDDPRAVWLRTLEFLGLPDDGRTTFPTVNVSRRHRFGGLADFVLDPPGPLKRVFHDVRTYLNRHRPPAIERLKRALRSDLKRPTLPPEFRAALEAEFAGEVAEVERLLERDLSAVWRRGGGSGGVAQG